MNYDYLVVGAGLYGAVFAREAKDKGKNVLVIDKRNHIAGNVYTEEIEGIESRYLSPLKKHKKTIECYNYSNIFCICFKPSQRRYHCLFRYKRNRINF